MSKITQFATLQDPPDRDEQFVYLDLDETDLDKKINLIKEFEDTLVPEGVNVPMGKMNVEPFDIDLIDNGDKYLREHRPKAFAARGPKRELLQASLEALSSNGGGENNVPGIEFASPCFLTSRRRCTNLRLCIAYNTSNDQTKNEVFAMPSIDELISMMAGVQYLAS